MDLEPTIKRLVARTAEFKKLPGKMRTTIVGYMKNQGMLGEEIADAIHVPRSTVYYHWERYQKWAGDIFRRHVHQTMGRFYTRAEILYSHAMKAKDYRLAWDIEKDLLSVMVKLGFDVKPPIAIDDAPTDLPRLPDSELEKQLAHDLEILGRIKKAQVPPEGDNGHGNGKPGIQGKTDECGDEGEREDSPESPA